MPLKVNAGGDCGDRFFDSVLPNLAAQIGWVKNTPGCDTLKSIQHGEPLYYVLFVAASFSSVLTSRLFSIPRSRR
jgi:hypothetical protein